MSEVGNGVSGWWRVGFVVLALAFETVREAAVLGSNEPIYGMAFSLYGDTNFVHAEGQWQRTDGGSPLVSKTTVFECARAWDSCIETNAEVTTYRTLQVYTDIHDEVHFEEDSIWFANDRSVCATYEVRFDLRQKRVTATRARKSVANCPNLEERIEMQLSDGSNRFDGAWTHDHTLPLLRLVQWVASLF